MGKTWGKIGVVFGVLSGLGTFVALADWINFPEEWRFATVGFIAGSMLVVLAAIFMWDRPYRQEKLARERKKMGLVQTMPTRQERLDELDDQIASSETEVEKSKILVRQNLQEANEYPYVGTWYEFQHKAVAAEWDGHAKMGEANLKKLRKERDRIEKLTDAEWRAEQVEKIHVPE